MSSSGISKKILCFFCNADWYFQLHWLDRAKAAMVSGYEVHLITGKTSDHVIAHLAEVGIHCHPIHFERGSFNPFNIVLTLYELQLKLSSISPCIVHSVTLLPSIEAALLSFFNRYKLVSTITGLGWVFSKKSLKAYVLKVFVVLLFKFFLKYRFDSLIFENNDDRNFFLYNSMCTRDKSLVILGAGVDTELFHVNSSSKLEPITKFLFASRLLLSKGLPNLIESCRILYDNNRNFELIICGIEDRSSPDTIPRSLINEWKLLPFVRWLGHQKDMPSVINACDVVVLPTIYGEGVPRILIEAASCSKPVIATDSPGCRDIVLHFETGMLIPTSDVGALKDAMLYMLTRPSITKEWGVNARRLVLNTFDNKVVINKTINVYSKILQ